MGGDKSFPTNMQFLCWGNFKEEKKNAISSEVTFRRRVACKVPSDRMHVSVLRYCSAQQQHLGDL